MARYRGTLCIFCYKAASSKSTFNRNKLPKFIDFLTRYLSIQSNSFDNLAGKELLSCDNCFKVVDKFCDLFIQWDNIRLQMEWKVSELLEIMRASETASVRVNDFKNQFTNGSDSFVYQFIQLLRADLSKACTKKLSSSLPKVVLEAVYIKTDEEILSDSENYEDYWVLHKGVQTDFDDDDDDELTDGKCLNIVPGAQANEQLPIEVIDITGECSDDEVILERVIERERHSLNEELQVDSDDIEIREENLQFFSRANSPSRVEIDAPWVSQTNESLVTLKNTNSKYCSVTSQKQKKKYKCEFEGCTKTFVQKVSLETHRRKHGIFGCSCLNCDCVFGNLADLRSHFKTHEPTKPKPASSYQCEVCLKHFRSSVLLKLHWNGHDVDSRKTLKVNRSQSLKKYPGIRKASPGSIVNVGQPQVSSAFSADAAIAHSIQPDENLKLSNDPNH